MNYHFRLSIKLNVCGSENAIQREWHANCLGNTSFCGIFLHLAFSFWGPLPPLSYISWAAISLCAFTGFDISLYSSSFHKVVHFPSGALPE